MYNSKSDRTLKKGRICKEEKGKNREIKSEEEERGRAKKIPRRGSIFFRV